MPSQYPSPCPGQIQTYFLKKSLCFAVVFRLFAIGLEICFTAKLANLKSGNAPTTIAKVSANVHSLELVNMWCTPK